MGAAKGMPEKRKRKRKRTETKGSSGCGGCSGCDKCVFAFQDLIDVREFYNRPSGNTPTFTPYKFSCLIPCLEDKRKEYLGDETRVPTYYGVPRTDRKLHHYKDPRVALLIKQRKDYKRRSAAKLKRDKEVYEMMQKSENPPHPNAKSDAMGVPSLEVMLNHLWELKKSKPPPIDKEIPEKSTDEIRESLRSKDLFAASIGLAFFNSKRSKLQLPPYYLDEVYGSHDHGYHITRWRHCNFRASLRDGSPAKLFFVELHDARAATFCCILDGMPQKRGCLHCPKHFVHPQKGGFLQGIDRDLEKDENAKLAVTNGVLIALNKRPSWFPY